MMLPRLKKKLKTSVLTSNLSRFHQKPHPPHALPLIRIQPEGQRHPRGQWFDMAKPDAVYWLTLVLQF